MKTTRKTPGHGVIWRSYEQLHIISTQNVESAAATLGRLHPHLIAVWWACTRATTTPAPTPMSGFYLIPESYLSGCEIWIC